MRYLNYFQWDQGKCVKFIPHNLKGRNHPVTWMEEMSPAYGWQRTQLRDSQRKLFPLSIEILESMEDPCKTVALLSLGDSLEVPSLKEEWRGALGTSILTGTLGTSMSVPMCPLQPGCAAEAQSAGGVQHCATGMAQPCCSCLPPL